MALFIFHGTEPLHLIAITRLIIILNDNFLTFITLQDLLLVLKRPIKLDIRHHGNILTRVVTNLSFISELSFA